MQSPKLLNNSSLLFCLSQSNLINWGLDKQNRPPSPRMNSKSHFKYLNYKYRLPSYANMVN